MGIYSTDVSFSEPDVICTYQGRQFGVAAKMGHSNRKLWKNVSKGVNQAESHAESAVVAVNVVEMIPVHEIHSQSLKMNLDDPNVAVDWATSWAHEWCDRTELYTTAEKLQRTEAQKIIGVAFFMPMMLVFRDHHIPFMYTHMPLQWGENSIDFDFAKSFLHACNQVFGFPNQEALKLSDI